jgi:hypothetical protein
MRRFFRLQGCGCRSKSGCIIIGHYAATTKKRMQLACAITSSVNFAMEWLQRSGTWENGMGKGCPIMTSWLEIAPWLYIIDTKIAYKSPPLSPLRPFLFPHHLTHSTTRNQTFSISIQTKSYLQNPNPSQNVCPQLR